MRTNAVLNYSQTQLNYDNIELDTWAIKHIFINIGLFLQRNRKLSMICNYHNNISFKSNTNCLPTKCPKFTNQQYIFVSESFMSQSINLLMCTFFCRVPLIFIFMLISFLVPQFCHFRYSSIMEYTRAVRFVYYDTINTHVCSTRKMCNWAYFYGNQSSLGVPARFQQCSSNVPVMNQQ